MRQLTPRERIANYARIAIDLPSFSARPYASRERVRSYQLTRLRRLVRFAYENVPLYTEKYRRAGVTPNDLRSLDDLVLFPSITKREVLDAYPDGALARGLDLERCLISKSSGSTGHVLSVVHRADRISIQGLALHRLISLFGSYRPWHRFTYVYTSEYPSRGALGMYPMEWIHTLSPVSEIASRLVRSPPRYLACYPSHLHAIAAELGEKRARDLSLRGISVSSELSSAEERQSLAKIFACRVLDEYSTEELTRVAAQCRHGTYHVFEDVVLMEILDEASDARASRGEVTGTYLHNFAMPFIRYRQGDIAEISDSPCACGWTFRSIAKLEGRKLDAFELPSGRKLTSGFLLDATYAFLFDVGADISAFRLVQEARNRVRIEIVPGRNFDGAMSDAVCAHFAMLVGEPIDVRVQLYDRIETTRAGKHQPIVSLVGRA
jgi:phenylacetate-coenzyme A ligase PaaK-like adenylate-forming protein